MSPHLLSWALRGSVTRPAEDISDEALLARLQKGDVDALGLLYRRYARLFYSIGLRILRDTAEAEDLVHEVLLRLYRKCNLFDASKGAGRSWIVQVAYSVSLNRLEAQHARSLMTEETTDASSATHELDPAYSILWNASMTSAFKSLSEEQQLALRLFYFQGLSFQEIAEKQGYSYGNAKHHVYRGIEHLRRILFRSRKSDEENLEDASMSAGGGQ